MVVAVIAAAVAVSGCGGDDQPTTTATTAAEVTDETTAGESGDAGVVSNIIEVTITDDALMPSNADPATLEPGETVTSTANSGKVTFELTNEASEAKSVVFNDSGKEIPLAKDLAPGDSTTATVDVTSGYYEYYDAKQGPDGPQAQLEVVD
jgi:uncharacterized cupredoxin-like copper-binding protein